METSVDRKVVVILLAKKISELIDGFAEGHAEYIRSNFRMEAGEVGLYLLDALPEAVAFVKAEKSR